MTQSLGFIPFGELAPDRPDLLNVGVEDARNVVARKRGFYPMPAAAPYSNALAARPVGMFTAFDKTDTRYMYGATQANLYTLSGVTWTDLSRTSPAYTNADRWEFLKWGETVQAWSEGNNPQTIGFGGSNFSDLTTAVQARTAAVVRQQVMVGNTYDATDGDVPNRVRWCYWNDPTNWAVNAANLSDFQDIKGANDITRVVGGEFALIFCACSIHRATFVGAPYVYQIDDLETGPGAVSGPSVVKYGNLFYFLASDGFRVTDGGGRSRLIGADRINRTVLEELDSTYLDRVIAAAYPRKQSILWSYPGPGAMGGQPNRFALYNYGSDRWAFGDEVVEIIGAAGVPYQSMDDLDTEFPNVDTDMTGSLDDSSYAGGAEQIGVFGSDYKLAFFSGDEETATITTGESLIASGRRAHIGGVRVGVVGSASVRVRVGHRNSLNDSLTWSEWSDENTEGVCPLRVNNRYFRFEVEVSGEYDHIFGMEPLGAVSSAR